MLFLVVSVLALIGVLFWRTFLRFLEAGHSRSLRDIPALVPEYAGWLGDRIRGLPRSATPAKARALYETWVLDRYPGWKQGIFAAFAVSFGFCAASGLVFAAFVHRGIFGVPLLLHVMSGGLFAVSFAALLLLRAGAYRPDAGPAPGGRVSLFWLLAAAGLVLVVTALAAMLPLFPFRAQFLLLDIHRYAALAALLAAIVFFDIDILPRRG